jgi:hypothetical protein
MSRWTEFEARFPDEPTPHKQAWRDWAVNKLLEQAQEIDRLRAIAEAAYIEGADDGRGEPNLPVTSLWKYCDTRRTLEKKQ